MEGELIRLRVVVRNPPKGVAFAMQIGRDELIPPTAATATNLVFETSAKIGASRAGALRLAGAAVQGPSGNRFLYINSGRRAGQADTCWDRRAKVMLGAIGHALLRRCAATDGTLEAEIDGVAGDGGPCCATVPIRGGWRVV